MKLNPSAKLGLLLILSLVIAAAVLFVGPTHTVDPNILWKIRFPRVLLGFLIGLGLSGAGVIYQGVLRNPLADPFVLGTSSAATTGVMVAGLFGLHDYLSLYFLALGFALLSIFIVSRLARVNGKTPVQTLILSGVIVSLFFNSAVFVFYSLQYRDSFNVLFYLLGSLTEGGTLRLGISGAIIIISLIICWIFARDLDLLTQGEETAHHLGLSVERTKKLFFILASVIVAAAVAAAGMIGFVGLITPHVMRMILGPSHRLLLPASALGGAILLILTDAVARTAVPPLEIPVGALTALLGTPYFIYLLRKRQSVGLFKHAGLRN